MRFAEVRAEEERTLAFWEVSSRSFEGVGLVPEPLDGDMEMSDAKVEGLT